MDRIGKLLEYLDASPGDSFLQHALALEYVKLGDDGKARNFFEKVLEKDPAYIGSYYHLGKLLERAGESELANSWYEQGMSEANKAGDRHAFNELRGAWDELNS